MFTFEPGLPPGFPHSPLRFTVSSRAPDLARARRVYGRRLAPFPGLGRNAVEIISPTAVVTVVALGHGFVLDLVSGQRRVDAEMTVEIAQKLYATAARAVRNAA